MDSPAPDVQPVAEESAASLRADLFGLWPEGARNDAARLGIALSGGPDSCALLLLAAAALPGRIEAATVDHGLRPGSAQEARDAGVLCETLGVPHATLPVTVAQGNLQAQARAARYAALAEWIGRRGLSALATAHHADDQAETLVARLNRASGVAGLAGTRARGRVPGTDTPLLRPLLHWRRAELRRIVDAAGWAPALDPSNDDPAFDRVRIREGLRTAPWIDSAALARSAGHLADADAALEWMARRDWQDNVTADGQTFRYRCAVPRAVALRVVSRIVRDISGKDARGGMIARAIDSLEGGVPASLGDVVARAGPDEWTFVPAERKSRDI